MSIPVNSDRGKPGLSGVVNKVLVTEALMEILSQIPGVKDLLNKSSSTLETVGQPASQRLTSIREQ